MQNAPVKLGVQNRSHDMYCFNEFKDVSIKF
jgi:hypothetical protein